MDDKLSYMRKQLQRKPRPLTKWRLRCQTTRRRSVIEHVTGEPGIWTQCRCYRWQYLSAIMMSKLLRDCCNNKLGRAVTYKPPTQNIPVSCNFIVFPICKPHTVGNGAQTRIKSVKTFTPPNIINTKLNLMHFAFTVGSHAARIGRHWKIAVRT